MTAKASKAEAHYRAEAPGRNRCAGCTMFRPPAGCTSVAGTISPKGVCDYFERKSATMAETTVAENNKGPVKNVGGGKPVREAQPAGAVADGPTLAKETRQKARAMLGRGVISQKEHDKLIGKADAVAAKTAGKG